MILLSSTLYISAWEAITAAFFPVREELNGSVCLLLMVFLTGISLVFAAYILRKQGRSRLSRLLNLLGMVWMLWACAEAGDYPLTYTVALLMGGLHLYMACFRTRAERMGIYR